MPAELKLIEGKRLEGKVAIVTGASRGMGRAVALLYGLNGANVIVNYFGNKEAADAVVNKIKEFGSGAVAVQADIGNLKDHQKLLDGALKNFGKLDILYHNAAMHYSCKELEDVTEEIWDATHNQILKGPFYLTRLCIPHILKAGGGSIIFTSTSSAGAATPMDPHYLTAKNGVNIMYKFFAGWVGPEIRVNCIVPGFVKTDMFRHHSPEMWKNLSEMLPMQKMATPLDVAHAALFLVSPEAEYLTGAALPVDGGRMSAVPRSGGIGPVIQAMKPKLIRYEKADYGEENIADMDVGLVDMDTDKKVIDPV
jgi:3-oxoacyl-[acyl-carrier protein] reductase